MQSLPSYLLVLPAQISFRRCRSLSWVFGTKVQLRWLVILASDEPVAAAAAAAESRPECLVVVVITET